MNTLLEYCERTGHFHNNDKKIELETNGYSTVCDNISRDNALEFGNHVRSKDNKGEIKFSLEEVKTMFVDFLLSSPQ